MAILGGPLFSKTASGKLGNVLNFSSHRGRHYARQLPQPADPQTGPQVSSRSLTAFLAQQWADLTPADQSTWGPLAETLRFSPYHAFLSVNLTVWGTQQPPSKQYPPTIAAPPPSAPDYAAIPKTKELWFALIPGPIVPQWGYAIHRSLTPAFTPSPANLVHLEPETAPFQLWIDSPLPSGVPQFYRMRGFSDDGVWGAFGLEYTNTPL